MKFIQGISENAQPKWCPWLKFELPVFCVIPPFIVKIHEKI